jgi:hypothetical protein
MTSQTRTRSFEGHQFGDWTVISDEGTTVGRSMRVVVVVCSCGTRKEVRLSHLLTGTSRSCHGNRTARIVHGHTHLMAPGVRKRSPEHSAWSSLKQRCLNPRNPAFNRYGGRGITVCTRWVLSFEDFLADMGPRPSPRHSIDRINNDGSYSSENCHWATQSEQNRNRPNKKLTADQIRAIRASTESSRIVGARFGVHGSTVKSIRCGRLHRDVA